MVIYIPGYRGRQNVQMRKGEYLNTHAQSKASGIYHAKPYRRAYIAKANGRKRARLSLSFL